MESAKKVTQDNHLADQTTQNQLQQAQAESFRQVLWKKIRGGLLVTIGYLLSPLCWWNDLIFNLPIAYVFGYICSLFSPDLLVPCSFAGYWLSNIAGIILMQLGAVDILQGKPQERNLKKDLLMGVASSTAYTIAILALIQFKIIELPSLFFPEHSFNLGSLLPWF
ncbi:MAG TPA: hypothetical protein VK211_18290 [Kamptonema sp.]|nr:hypothetical protein [Kamptonema sp.]